jgi:hypothetical protein
LANVSPRPQVLKSQRGLDEAGLGDELFELIDPVLAVDLDLPMAIWTANSVHKLTRDAKTEANALCRVPRGADSWMPGPDRTVCRKE